MLDKIIENNTDEMISALGRLIAIPSVSKKNHDEYIYGKDVNDALEEAVKTAKKLGFWKACGNFFWHRR